LIDLPPLGHDFLPRLIRIRPCLSNLLLQFFYPQVPASNDVLTHHQLIPQRAHLFRGLVSLNLQFANLRFIKLLEGMHVLVVLVVVLIDVQRQLSDVVLQVLNRRRCLAALGTAVLV
jgi:hypothetical protein